MQNNIQLRPYQIDAVNAVNSKSKNGILVLPTSAGKSWCIANIVNKLAGKTLILQPNKEILEQNYAKYCNYGFSASIYSASLNRKEFSNVVFATIGSVISSETLTRVVNSEVQAYKSYILIDFFKDVKNIIIDECHYVNAKEGMYEGLIKLIKPEYLIGLTATPYRMATFGDAMTGEKYITAKMLTRTKPKLFDDLIYICNPEVLYENGYLTRIIYNQLCEKYNISKIKLNKTGTDFDEVELLKYNMKMEIYSNIEKIVLQKKHKRYLIFCNDISEIDIIKSKLKQHGLKCEGVSSKDSIKDRTDKINAFKLGEVNVLVNVGVLTTGVDVPILDCIILAKPTMSIVLYQQILGRGTRIHPDKKFCYLYDLCDNVRRFGEIEHYHIKDTGNKKYRLFCKDKPLTGVNFANKMEDIELNNPYNRITPHKSVVDSKNVYRFMFGQYSGKLITHVPAYYIKYCAEKFKDGEVKQQCIQELNRRLGK